MFNDGDRSKYSDYQREIASIFFFIKKIMLNVEVVDPASNHLLVYFPKKPQCFMLAAEDKKNYNEECDISDSNTKMLDLMRNFQLFSIQMESNMASFRKSKIVYQLTSKDAFRAYMIFCWTFGAMVNLFGAFWVIRVNSSLIPADSTKELWLKIMSFFLSGFALFCLILWFAFRYPQRRKISREDFIFDNPGVDPDTTRSWIKINLIKSLFSRGTPVNMTLHIIFSMVGVFSSWFILSLNLMLVVNISRTCKFVIKAITIHAD